MSKKTTKSLVPKPTTAEYPTDPQSLQNQQARLNKAAAEGAAHLKPSAPAATPGLAAAPTNAPSKPLAPLAAMWPEAGLPTAEAKAIQIPAPQPEKAPTPAKSPKQSLPASPAAPKAVAPVEAPRQRGIKVNFALVKPDAKKVSLCGEFNGWSPEATPMRRTDGGRWETTLVLQPGKYQYKFVADGQWLADPVARENVPNVHGSLNSVMEVRA
jgi:hypothetical protein